ncbi:D-Ala-D-Ala carboxypeptidase family metallohydrolase [Spartinivicinus ruber]|uniref:D-Ala-D-Ala carboxypeptidase family metallohydrolase n=1 Tax=Spartinivicinus ruber TaxID=2683272 RepID=UPI0013D5E9F2|nr:D-Ala-D-Ala carboxypeptidase family metallohydrolase [Spartinivicinus ruber]
METVKTINHPWPYFSRHELACRCGCGQCVMQPAFMERLITLREACNFPLPVTSGYRCANHPAEKHKTHQGTHQLGEAVDIRCRGQQALQVIQQALVLGFTGVGIQQKGSSRFIHLDASTATVYRPRPFIWSY